MGLNVAASILESGGDVVCIDRMEEPLPELWCASLTYMLLSILIWVATSRSRYSSKEARR